MEKKHHARHAPYFPERVATVTLSSARIYPPTRSRKEKTPAANLSDASRGFPRLGLFKDSFHGTVPFRIITRGHVAVERPPNRQLFLSCLTRHRRRHFRDILLPSGSKLHLMFQQ